MTLRPGRLRLLLSEPAPPAESGLADGPRAVPLTVLVFLVLDIGTTMVGQAFGVANLGGSGPLAALQRCLLIATAAATMWHRPRSAVVLAAAVVTLVFAVDPTGEELWLVVIVMVTAAIRASPRQLLWVLVAQITYLAFFGSLVEQAYPGEGWAARGVMLAVVGGSLSVGLIARWLLQARDRRRIRVRQLEREQTEIRAVERARLADELQVLVTEGLASITDELDRVGQRPADVPGLQAVLAQIGLGSRSLLDQLRVLLDVLRRDGQADPVIGPPPAGSGPRRWVDLLTARHVRIAATAVLGLIAVRAAVASLGAPPAEVVVEVGGVLACALAVWRPVPATSCAVAVVFASVVLGSSGYSDVVSTTLLGLIAALSFRSSRFWFVMLSVSGYAAMLAFTEVDPVDHVLLVCLAGFAAVATGLAVRHLVTARRQSLRQLADLAQVRARMESEERGSVARDLHDVVAHSLSLITMLVMATSLSQDRERLADTLDKVRRNVDTARQELSTLVQALRGPAGDRTPVNPLVSPLASASTLARRLAENGYQPVLALDRAADGLDPTTQRTLSRILTEAVTNILRYAPAGSACHLTLGVDDAGVALSVVSPLAGPGRRSDLSLGWGLRGIRERVELTHGSFAAGPERGRWVLRVTLPTATPAWSADDSTVAESEDSVVLRAG